MIAGLVDQGLATLTAEKVLADEKLVAVAKARITEEGRLFGGQLGYRPLARRRPDFSNRIRGNMI